MGKAVLLVDDDEKLQALLKEYLEGYGFQVRGFRSAGGVLETLRAEPPALVVLDVMLPGKNGLEILRDIRAESTVPVLMLTAKGDETDRIVGLEMGADDYLPKPFNPRELLARMNAVLRRQGGEADERKREEGPWIHAGGVALNTARQTVTVDGMEHELSSTEYRLLKVLMTHPDTVLSRDQLMNLAMGRDHMAYDRSIDVHISRIRAMVETDPKSPRRIRTVWGSGYRFVADP
jgi:two-component system phosphate regulon response regulator OmpR